MNRCLDAFARPIALDLPARLTATSAWKEHAPFALNLVAALRPGAIVELGTHTGDSYCAMCQAVASEALDTRCFAVDTWEGDAHSGRYGPEVLADLRAHHDPAYGGFSRLVQSTFQEALGQFADGFIDLLHIDGYHTYQAVKADFEAWLPKMSPAGVVMLHDVNVREGDFGVWKLWGEIASRFPHFEFVHGHGLGVAAVGTTTPEGLRPLLGASDSDVEVIRRYFFTLGQRVHHLEGHTRALRDVALLQGEVAGRDAAVRGSNERLARLEELSRDQQGRISEQYGQASELRARIAELEKEVQARDALLAASSRRAEVLAGRVLEQEKEARARQDLLTESSRRAQELTGRILEQGKEERGRQALLAESRRRIQELESRLRAIESSRGYALLARYYRLRDAVRGRKPGAGT